MTLKRTTWDYDHTSPSPGKQGRLQAGALGAPPSKLHAKPKCLAAEPAFVSVEAEAWLGSLGLHGEKHWVCCCDLNLLFNRFFNTLPGSSLKSYHSFVLQPKESLWQHLTVAHGIDPGTAAAAAQGTGPAPMHLLMAGQILSHPFSHYPEAGAVRYTIIKPPWLFGWSSKYQHHSNTLSVLEIQAGLGGKGRAASLFIPVF